MDDQQAAAVLRDIAIFQGQGPRREAAGRGAYALEMLEWLTEPKSPTGLKPRFARIYHDWARSEDADETFRAFCEARFEESKKHG